MLVNGFDNNQGCRLLVVLVMACELGCADSTETDLQTKSTVRVESMADQETSDRTNGIPVRSVDESGKTVDAAGRLPWNGPFDRPSITNSEAGESAKRDTGVVLANAESPAETDGDESAVEPEAGPATDHHPPLFEGWPKPKYAIVVTGRQYGYVEPCGCAGLENQKGGLTRRHQLIRQLTKRSWNVVPLDAGNQVRRYGRQAEIKFQMTATGLQKMGYQAIALGPDDLRLPALELAAVMAPTEGPSRFVCANATVVDSSFTSKWTLIEAGGQKIGVTAVLGARNQKRVNDADVSLSDAAESIDKVWPEMQQASCDLYLLIVHGSLEESTDLARRFPQFPLLITTGGAGEPARQPEAIDGAATKLIQVGTKGMYAGVIGVYDSTTTPWRYQRVPLDSRFTDSDEMLQLLAAYQESLANAGLEGLGIRAQPIASGRAYVGSASCEECHEDEYEIWKEGRDGHPSKHAHAFATLQHPPQRSSIPRDNDPECLSCHVVGWNPQKHFPYVSGFLSNEQTPDRVNVGCENCHGPGSAHVAAENGDVELDEDAMDVLRKDMQLALKKAEQKCLVCHDLDNSPDFQEKGAFDRYWKQIKH